MRARRGAAERGAGPVSAVQLPDRVETNPEHPLQSVPGYWYVVRTSIGLMR